MVFLLFALQSIEAVQVTSFETMGMTCIDSLHALSHLHFDTQILQPANFQHHSFGPDANIDGPARTVGRDSMSRVSESLMQFSGSSILKCNDTSSCDCAPVSLEVSMSDFVQLRIETTFHADNQCEKYSNQSTDSLYVGDLQSANLRMKTFTGEICCHMLQPLPLLSSARD